jgi:YD repeat-containing protein
LPGGTGTTTYLYQGNTTKVTDPAGKWKTYTTDALGNLTKVTEPNPAGGADLDSNYTYNLFNRLTQTSMTRSSTTQTRTFTYDNTTQRLTSVAHPESGTIAYTYNADGTVATKVDAKNQKIGSLTPTTAISGSPRSSATRFQPERRMSASEPIFGTIPTSTTPTTSTASNCRTAGDG